MSCEFFKNYNKGYIGTPVSCENFFDLIKDILGTPGMIQETLLFIYTEIPCRKVTGQILRLIVRNLLVESGIICM